MISTIVECIASICFGGDLELLIRKVKIIEWEWGIDYDIEVTSCCS